MKGAVRAGSMSLEEAQKILAVGEQVPWEEVTQVSTWKVGVGGPKERAHCMGADPSWSLLNSLSARVVSSLE